MAFFNKLSEMAKNIGDKTGDAIEVTKLNNKIRTERSAAAEDFKRIGEYYYGLYAAGNEAAPEILEFCQSAKAHLDAAADAQAEIERIRANDAEPEGAPTAAAKSFCPSCGAANDAGTRFCSNCGAKLEAPPQERKCPDCGSKVSPGVHFCANCGHRMED